MSRNIIKLNEEYGLSCDDMNIILMERKVNKDAKSKNFGSEYYINIGYYGNIESLLKNLVNKRIMLEVSENDTLEALVLSVERYISLLYTDVAVVVKELRKSV